MITLHDIKDGKLLYIIDTKGNKHPIRINLIPDSGYIHICSNLPRFDGGSRNDKFEFKYSYAFTNISNLLNCLNNISAYDKIFTRVISGKIPIKGLFKYKVNG